MTAVRRIDGHVHLWNVSRGDYDWMTPDLTALYRDFGPGDLAPLLDAAGMDQAVLVQAAETVAECEFLLDIAAGSDRIAGVVGWLDMASPQFASQLESYSRNPHFKGVRPMIQDYADDGWMLAERQRPAFARLEETGTCFDCLVYPKHLDNLMVLLDRHPALRAIIDHGAKPDIAGGGFGDWAEKMSVIAARTSALCKFSGLITEAGEDWTVERLHPYTDHLLATFGPDRLVFGSDWPVLTLGADYPRWMEAANRLLADLDEAEQAKIFGGNAARFYRL
jgi:L-fuconolactonase